MNVYEYREGLPSEEEVRAHAEVHPVESSKGRRGRWMGMGECGDLRIFDMSPNHGGDPPWHIDATEDGAICDMERVANDVKRWRPCAPDGTPCAWPNQDRRNEGGHPLKPFTDLLYEMNAQERHLASEIAKLIAERQAVTRIKSHIEDKIEEAKKILGAGRP